MKEKFIPLYLVIAIAITTIFFRAKIDHIEEPVDVLEAAFSGIEEIVPENANVSLLCLDDTISYDRLYCWTRYLLAPRFICSYANEFDTVLVIEPLNSNKYLSNPKVMNRKVLWKKEHDVYRFLLTCSNPK